MDMRKAGGYTSILQPITTLLDQTAGPRRGAGQAKGKELALKLFRKAWEAFPQNRANLLSRIRSEELWQLPEIYQFAKEAVIPREDSEADPVAGGDGLSVVRVAEGRMEGILTPACFRSPRKQQAASPELAAPKWPRPRPNDWTGWPARCLLAVIDVQMGAKEQGKKEWREVFDDPKADVPGLARFMLCQELEFYAGVEDLAIKALEGGIDEIIRDMNFDFSYSPGRRLAWWYELMGRHEDAKKLRMRFLGGADASNNVGYPDGYREYQRAQSTIVVAQEFLRDGEPVEAVRLYNKLLADPDVLELANRYGGETFDKQVELELKQAIGRIGSSAALPAVLQTSSGGERNSVAATGPCLDLSVARGLARPGQGDLE